MSAGSFGSLVNLVRVDASGSETSEIPNLFLFRKDDGGAGAFYKYNHASGRFAIGLVETKLFDWDGDGEVEAHAVAVEDFHAQADTMGRQRDQQEAPFPKRETARRLVEHGTAPARAPEVDCQAGIQGRREQMH